MGRFVTCVFNVLLLHGCTTTDGIIGSSPDVVDSPVLVCDFVDNNHRESTK